MTDWSTSYHAGSSRCALRRSCSTCEILTRLCSSESRLTSDDETDDDFSTNLSRGRPHSQRKVQVQQEPGSKHTASPLARRRSAHSTSSCDSKSNPSRYHHTRRTSFTRSRSPAVLPNPTNSKFSNKLNSPNLTGYRKWMLLPGDCRLYLRLPLTTLTWTISIDCRKLGETFLLLVSLLYAGSRISTHSTPQIAFIVSKNSNELIAKRNNCFDGRIPR